MLSNFLANFALARARSCMDRYYRALGFHDELAADEYLRAAEYWDDVRMWIDGMGSWRALRIRRRAEREYHARLSRPFAETIVEGPGL